MSSLSSFDGIKLVSAAVRQNAVLDPDVRITHVIFDVDGLLLDTETLYTTVLSNMCLRHGKEFDWNVKKAVMGLKETQAAQTAIDFLRLPVTTEEFLADARTQLETLFLETKLMPGAYKLVEHLYHHSLPLALATGSSNDSYEAKMYRHNSIREMFEHAVISGDDDEVKHGKPHPDIYEICMRRYVQPPLSPRNVLVFEDALNGVSSAVAAGTHCVAVPDVREDISQFRAADFVISSLLDFEPTWYNLPAYKN